MSEYCKNCFELQNKIDELETENEQLKAHKGITETQIIDEFVMYFAKIIAEEQPDCKNVDYRLPETLRICKRLQEIEKEIIYVAQAIQFNNGKSNPIGDTGSPRSYKRWEKQLCKRLAHEFKL